MKGILFILGLAGALLAPASAYAVACPTLGSSLYDSPGSNCQMGSLVTSGPTPLVAGIPQGIVASSTSYDSQEVSWGGVQGGGVTSPAPVLGNVVFFGPQFMTAVSAGTIAGGPGVNGPAPLSVPMGRPCGTLGNPCTVATPEPASLVLLGSGLIVLGGAAFRRYRRRHVDTLQH